MPQTPLPSIEQLRKRYQEEYERNLFRVRKGLELVVQPREPVLGVTPHDVIWERGTLKLLRYRPQAETSYPVPLLMVMSLVSRPYILDLYPGNSFVEFLLRQGLDVYLMDWGIPRPQDKHLTLDDYTQEFIPRAVEAVQAESGASDISMLGYCLGGVLALMYAGTHHGGPLRNLISLTTPVDFQKLGIQSLMADKRFFDVDKLVDTLGNVPPQMLEASFDMLRPLQRFTKYVDLWYGMWDSEFVESFRAIDRWGSDQIPFAGEAFRQVVKELMWENKLLENRLTLGGEACDLSHLQASFLAVAAEHDHIVPRDASQPLLGLVGSPDKEEIILKGGHVSLVAGRNATKRLWPRVAEWLGERSSLEGKHE